MSEEEEKMKPIAPKEIEEKRKAYTGDLSKVEPIPAEAEKLADPNSENIPAEVKENLGDN